MKTEIRRKCIRFSLTRDEMEILGSLLAPAQHDLEREPVSALFWPKKKQAMLRELLGLVRGIALVGGRADDATQLSKEYQGAKEWGEGIKRSELR